MIKTLLRPLYFYYKRNKELRKFKKSLRANAGELKIVVGSAGIYDQGWIPTEAHFLDLLKEETWTNYFQEASISNIMAEHVWEHLTPEDGLTASKMCFKFLKNKGGRLRIAVPDGYHPSKDYIDYVKPGGSGAGADDHKILYNYHSMSEMLQKAGFQVFPVEYFDENGVFQHNSWDKKDGFIHRSIENDSRNADGNPNYTSLIVDAVKV